MKLIFLKIAAISAGVVFALAAILAGIYWYTTRPIPERPWDESVFIADGPPNFYEDDDSYISLSYRLRNQTAKDFDEDSNYRHKLVVVRPDKSLTNPIPNGTVLVATPVFIPAHQSGTFKIKIRASFERKAGVTDEVFQQQLRKYLVSIMHGGEYFALFDEARHCRINLPAVREN
ncbi:MAG TPA: hypothetical protein VKD70_12160 [Candidatus Acidoferrum sp.]|nr:hypothetical protein [Candidatus Acidoferrum sp.]